MARRVHRPRKVAESIIPKDRLAKEVARILDDQGLTQTEASYRIRDSPSQVSLIVNGKTRGFSADRLLRILTTLGRDVDIAIGNARSGAGKVRLIVR
jgi:predicted XRE-type DNA-binding protein